MDRAETLRYARSIAEKLSRHVSGTRAVTNDEALLQTTAREWLQLMDQEIPDPDQVAHLIETLDSHDLGSAWYEMCLFSKRWKEIVLLSR